MADEPAPALAEEQPFALEPGTPGAPVAGDPAPVAEAPAEPAAPAEPPAPSPETVKAQRIAEIIRSHLRNSAVSRSVDAWNHLESQLPAICAEISKEA